MAVTLAVTDGYATIAEADTYLEDVDTNWVAATDEVKADALMWGRYYIDDNFDYDLDAIDAIDEEAKLANSVLAADYVRDGKLFGSSDPAIQSKTVKADVVSTSVTYATTQPYRPDSVGKAFALMKLIAERKYGNCVSLIRG